MSNDLLGTIFYCPEIDVIVIAREFHDYETNSIRINCEWDWDDMVEHYNKVENIFKSEGWFVIGEFD